MHRNYLTLLQRLNAAVRSEMDVAQLGQPPTGRLEEAMAAVGDERRRILQDGISLETKDLGRG